MNRRKNILIILIPVSIFILIFFSMYVFNVYGDVIKKHPENLFADHSSTIKIEVIPVNAFGWTIPFRYSTAEFIFLEGESLIEIVELDQKKGFIILRSKDTSGKVEISIKSQFSLFPNLIRFEILALTG